MDGRKPDWLPKSRAKQKALGHIPGRHHARSSRLLHFGSGILVPRYVRYDRRLNLVAVLGTMKDRELRAARKLTGDDCSDLSASWFQL